VFLVLKHDLKNLDLGSQNELLFDSIQRQHQEPAADYCEAAKLRLGSFRVQITAAGNAHPLSRRSGTECKRDENRTGVRAGIGSESERRAELDEVSSARYKCTARRLRIWCLVADSG